MDTTMYRTGTTGMVLSALAAARVRVNWHRADRITAPVGRSVLGKKCAQFMLADHDARPVQGRGIANDTFPTRSGPPSRPA